MVAMVQRMDTDRIHRSVWRRAFADSHTNAESNTDSDSHSYAEWRITQQHACSASKPNRR